MGLLLKLFKMHFLIYIISSFILALGISLYSVPVVVRVARSLRFLDNPNERSAAEYPIPTLGGISIFLSFIFAATIGLSEEVMPELVYIIIAVLIMFFVGLKDDILTISARKKLVAQFITAGMIIFFAKIRFTNLHGFLGMGEIGMVPGVILTFFAIIVIINAFNLMDGIDGLCAGLSMLAATAFGTCFLSAGILITPFSRFLWLEEFQAFSITMFMETRIEFSWVIRGHLYLEPLCLLL